MRRLIIERPALADIKRIRARSRRVFGAGAQANYGVLMQRAFKLLCANPERAGVSRREDLHRAPYAFHLRHARTRGASPKQPRHIIFFTFDTDTLRVLRILHDSMDIAHHFSLSDDEE